MLNSNTNKTILFVNFSTFWGGGESQHLGLAEEFINQGHNSVVMTQPNSVLLDRAIEKNIPTEVLKITNVSFLNPFVLSAIRNVLNRINPDAVILNSSLELKHFAFATSSKKCKLIYRRGFFSLVKPKMITKFCIKRLSALVAVSNHVKDVSLSAIAPFSRHEVVVINNGIKPAAVKTIPAYESKCIIAVGRLDACKQFDILIKAMPSVLAKVPQATLRIVGDGEEYGKLAQLIIDLNLSAQVSLLGFQSNVAQLLSESALFVHPSKYEAFGVVYLEAMRQKLASITFSGHAGEEIIIDKETGVIVDKLNSHSLSDSICSIIDNADQLKIMGEKAYSHFLNNYTIEQSVRKYLKLINK